MKKNNLLNTLLLSLNLAYTSSNCAEEMLKISTTTSTENSGLLAVLNPVFEEKYKVKIHVIAVGTGKALKIGGNGDVDAVFVHAPAAELKYVAQGDFIDRVAVMHNDFIIAGPKNDYADIASTKTVIEALAKIADKQVNFISRGDDSGTHKKELQLWKQAQIEPNWNGYLSVGQGMGAALRIANDKQAYVLTDRGTQIAFSDKTSLKILSEGDKALFNPYHVMAVNPEKHKHVRYDLAKKYINFAVSAEGQAIINNYRIEGKQLFYPDAEITILQKKNRKNERVPNIDVVNSVPKMKI